MNRIPVQVQSILSSSNQIKSLSKVVEELVYNSLDADATSIAIRINIQNSKIQVIDNGCGVLPKDFYSIGQKYMTSKFVDLDTLKSFPNKYGYRGQCLANIINVSKSVILTSRHEKSEVTWMKLFEYGNEKQIKICNPRPSKGTTVEVTGFLYNQNTWNKSKDILCELQKIKKFLEHLSLVHSNVSLSLRDDSKNEIIFTMHKNRDTHQTLSSLYHIKKEDLQELQVEKNEYKVTGFFGISNEDIDKHYIFLNGKFLDNSSKLHKLVNKNLSTNFNMRGMKKTKKINKKDEESIVIQKIPFYFIFIKCPYIDYNLSNSPKQSILEFKDWNQVTKLLDKLVKFFKGDINLKVAEKVETKKETRAENSNTRDQVKQIMEKILGNHSKKSGISNMRNGIKGKQIKRKVKKLLEKDNQTEKKSETTINVNHTHTHNNKLKNNDIPNDKNTVKYTKLSIKELNKIQKNNKENTKKYSRSNTDKSPSGSYISKSFNTKFKKISNNSKTIACSMQSQKRKLCNKNKTTKNTRVNKIIKKFEMQTASVKKRFKELEQKTKNKLHQLNNRKNEVLVSENIQYSNINKNNVYNNYSIRKKIGDNHNNPQNMPRQPKDIEADDHEQVCNRMKNTLFHSNYDLLQTILKTQEEVNVYRQVDEINKSVVGKKQKRNLYHTSDVGEKMSSEPLITFQSHNYYNHGNYNAEYYIHNDNIQHTHNNDIRLFKKRPRTFITKQSRDKIINPNKSLKQSLLKKKYNRTGYSNQFKSSIKRLFRQTSKLFDMKKQILGNTCTSSYTIEFTQSNNFIVSNCKDEYFSETPRKTNKNIEEKFTQSVNYGLQNSNNFSIMTNTFTVSNTNNNGYTIDDADWNLYGTYTVEHRNAKILESEARYEEIINRDDNASNSRNFIFISKSQDHDQNQEIMDPIKLCETILDGKESFDNDIDLSFYVIPNDLLSHSDQHKITNTSLPNNNEQNCLNAQNNSQVEDIPTHDIKIHNQEVSQYFIQTSKKKVDIGIDNIEEALRNQSPIITSRALYLEQSVKHDLETHIVDVKDPNPFNFRIKNRPCFLPKGMSQIFENCHTKNACDYKLTTDYYKDDMYNNFVDNVRNNAEVFKPKIQDANELTTKALDKVNNKLNIDNSSLKFDGLSLKGAKVLGQIDEKFIAAIMKVGYNIEADSDYLVLFDQHAVHERIRLEDNLAEYFNENQWKPVAIDEVSLKMSNDDILYLHNYKDKFERLGLKWTVTNSNEVSIAAIPEAILGKNPRQVDKVIKAVKSLITEEINIIKMQGGCVSLYPKSIMDLVFSEACRYAIMFGDKLSKNECEELLRKLSECKTPFQCAHGRPVMAVIMDIKTKTLNYKVNVDKIMKWKLLRQ